LLLGVRRLCLSFLLALQPAWLRAHGQQQRQRRSSQGQRPLHGGQNYLSDVSKYLHEALMSFWTAFTYPS
jgi:hypothetical protein